MKIRETEHKKSAMRPGAVTYCPSPPKASKGADRYNGGKPPLEFLADFPTAMAEFARVCQEGAKKYARNNWRKGQSVREATSSLLRHTFKFQRGEDFDADFLENQQANILHLAQIMWNAAAMIEWLADPDLNVDDRDKKGVDAKLMAKSQSVVGKNTPASEVLQSVEKVARTAQERADELVELRLREEVDYLKTVNDVDRAWRLFWGLRGY